MKEKDKTPNKQINPPTFLSWLVKPISALENLEVVLKFVDPFRFLGQGPSCGHTTTLIWGWKPWTRNGNGNLVLGKRCPSQSAGVQDPHAPARKFYSWGAMDWPVLVTAVVKSHHESRAFLSPCTKCQTWFGAWNHSQENIWCVRAALLLSVYGHDLAFGCDVLSCGVGCPCAGLWCWGSCAVPDLPCSLS